MTKHVEVPTITLETADQCVHDWFNFTVDANVESPQGQRQKAAVSFSSGERWIAAREKKGVRDKNGVLILPLISIRRSGIEAQPEKQAYGVETPNIVVSRQISPKTSIIQNANYNRPVKLQTPVVYEITTIPYPDFSVLTYEIQIQAQYITQMNAILEKMFHELDIQKSFVMPIDRTRTHPPTGEPSHERLPFDGGYLVGLLDASLNTGDNFEEFTDQERIVRYTCGVRVPIALLLDPEGEKPSIQVEKTAFKVNMGLEKGRFVDDPDDMARIFDSRDPLATYLEIKKRKGLK
jgi:hypothetical protein